MRTVVRHRARLLDDDLDSDASTSQAGAKAPPRRVKTDAELAQLRTNTNLLLFELLGPDGVPLSDHNGRAVFEARTLVDWIEKHMALERSAATRIGKRLQRLNKLLLLSDGAIDFADSTQLCYWTCERPPAVMVHAADESSRDTPRRDSHSTSEAEAIDMDARLSMGRTLNE